MTAHPRHEAGAVRRIAAMWRRPGLGQPASRPSLVLTIFVLLVFLTGGGARHDITSLVLLRPAAVLFGAYFIWLTPSRSEPLGLPFWLLMSLVIWVALQLVPLPPTVWAALPGHGSFGSLANAVGVSDSWRPISLTPGRTWNTLFSLAVPVAGYVGYRSLDESQRPLIWRMVLAMGLVSMALGGLQMLGSDRGPLYLYAISNFDSPVGLLANRNHQALLIASMLPIGAELYLRAKPRGDARLALRVRYGFGLIAAMVLLLLTGSRMGLAAGVLGIAGVGLLMETSRTGPDKRDSAAGTALSFLRSHRLMLICLIAAFTALLLYSGRTVALDRLLASDNLADMRWRSLPYVAELILRFLPMGSGFGSFDAVWRTIEPVELLRPTYFNQAHNDWLQFPLEGGAPAIVIMIIAVAWLLRSSWMLARPAAAKARATVVGRSGVRGAIVCVLIALASLTDYPLRVPSLMLLLSFCCYDVVLAVRQRGAKIRGFVANDF